MTLERGTVQRSRCNPANRPSLDGIPFNGIYKPRSFFSSGSISRSPSEPECLGTESAALLLKSIETAASELATDWSSASLASPFATGGSSDLAGTDGRGAARLTASGSGHGRRRNPPASELMLTKRTSGRPLIDTDP
jgi:hypothetical protein